MKTRPKLVSFVAVQFGLIAAAAFYSFVIDVLRLWHHHRSAALTKGIIAFVVAVFYWTVCRGVWTLSSRCRVLAIWLGVFDFLVYPYIVLLDHKGNAELMTRDMVEI